MGLMKNIAMSRGFKGFDIRLDQSDINVINQKLENIDKDLRGKSMMKALRAGGRVFIKEAKARVKSDRVEKGIRGTTKTLGGVKGYIAGPSKGFPNPAWLEYGTLDRYTGGGGGKGSYRIKETKRVRGRDGEFFTLRAGRVITRGMRAQPFIRPTFETKYQAMINKIAEVIGKEIEKHGR